MLLALPTARAEAKAAVGYTRTSADSEVRGPMEEVHRRAELVFADLGITPAAGHRTFKETRLLGTIEGRKVEVWMKASSPTWTSVYVTAQSGPGQYDKDYAGDVLQRIRNKS